MLYMVYHGRVSLLRRVEGVEVFGVGPQLLHCPGSECVAPGDQDPQPVLHQPETHLCSSHQTETDS